MLGALISSGHDPDWLITAYSFEQLALFARTVLQHKLELVNMVVGPVVGSEGDGWKDAKVSKGKRSPTNRSDGTKGRTFRAGDQSSDEAKEKGLLMALSAVGVRVKTVNTSGKGGGDAPTGS